MNREILVLGLRSDSTIIHFLVEARLRNIPVLALDLDELVEIGDWRLAVPDDGESYLSDSRKRVALSGVSGIYVRPISLRSTQRDAFREARWRGLIAGLLAWLEICPNVTVNRPGGHQHNSTKPLHEQWLREAGFDVPDSISSSSATALRKFVSDCEHNCISKLHSGMRADTVNFDSSFLDAYDAARGPIHLQRFQPGIDVRAHVIGSRVIAQSIMSEVTDYRAGNSRTAFNEYRLPSSLEARMIEAAQRMGLLFTGWDFRVSQDNTYWCLEANPMPGYRYYDSQANGSISEALFRLLGH